MGNIGCNPEMWEKILDAVPSDHLGLSCDPSQHWKTGGWEQRRP